MKKNEKYELTVKGFLSGEIGKKAGDELYDKLELYMRRHYALKGYAAIILDGKEMFFTTVGKE